MLLFPGSEVTIFEHKDFVARNQMVSWQRNVAVDVFVKKQNKKQTFFSQVVLVVCFKGLDCEDLVFFCVFIPDPPWPLIVPGCVSFPWLPFVYLILPVFLVESSSCLPSMSLLSVPWYQFLPIFYFFPYATAAMRADFDLSLRDHATSLRLKRAPESLLCMLEAMT